ncbi:apolipoprotein C-II isoform X1 [Canis aureus]
MGRWISRAIKPFSARVELVRTACQSRLSQWSRSSEAMGTRYLLVLLLVLLVLGFEVQGAHESQQDETTSSALLTQMQESLYSYWGTARSAAEDLYKKAYPTTMDEKIRDIYSKSTAAVSTYAGIFTDQLLSMLKGDS